MPTNLCGFSFSFNYYNNIFKLQHIFSLTHTLKKLKKKHAMYTIKKLNTVFKLFFLCNRCRFNITFNFIVLNMKRPYVLVLVQEFKFIISSQDKGMF